MGAINLTGDCGLAGAVHEHGEMLSVAQFAMVQAANKDLGYVWPEGRAMTDVEKAEHAASKAAAQDSAAAAVPGKTAPAAAGPDAAAPKAMARGPQMSPERPRRAGNLGVSVNATPNPPAPASTTRSPALGNEYQGRRLG